MKELSIEEKAKAYDEAIERAKEFVCKDNVEVAEYIFPELKESEDEKIRKRLLELFKEHWSEEWYGLKVKDVIAWLEKQGNLMKALQISNAKIGELIEKNYYLKEQLEKQGNNMGISETTKQELEDNLNKALEKETPESCNEFLNEQGEQKPTVEMKTPEESLGIDSDIYNKIVDECVYGEQKPAWSEEDEDILNTIINHFKVDIECTDEDDMVRWLKSLKERVQPQPNQEWSEEDERILNTVIHDLRYPGVNYYKKPIEEKVNWLKSLKERFNSKNC